jgi:DNA-binding CsgD family transcriptional regulator
MYVRAISEAPLTPRERVVLQFWLQSTPNGEIAAKVNQSPSIVSAMIRNGQDGQLHGTIIDKLRTWIRNHS